MARIVFDLDGTLVDSLPSLHAVGCRLLAELDRPPVPLDGYQRFVGHGLAWHVEHLLKTTGGIPGGDADPHVARYRAIYAADPVAGTEAYPGAEAALARLAGQGHRLGVCTQKDHVMAETVLLGTGLLPHVTAITGGGSLAVLKPHPAMLWHCADRLGDGPVIFVGDSETDRLTAANAGVPFVLHGVGYHDDPPAADASFDDFAALPGIVARLLARAA